MFLMVKISSFVPPWPSSTLTGVVCALKSLRTVFLISVNVVAFETVETTTQSNDLTDLSAL